MSDYTPVNSDSGAVTLTAGAVITGGLLVTTSGADDTVVHTTSTANRAIGVAASDAPSGGRVTVYLLPGFIHEVPAENGVTPTNGLGVICSTTPGRVTSTTMSSTLSNGAVIIGMFTRSTTGSTAATVRCRFLGS